MPSLWEPRREALRPTSRCHWCLRSGIYTEGTKCKHGLPPTECVLHGKWTDLNLVARGRRAVVKCAHYGNAFVVLYADPMSDNAQYGTYTVQFAIPGVGSELYIIPSQRQTCPHAVFDSLVKDMRNGVRPSVNRVPAPTEQVAKPGEALDE